MTALAKNEQTQVVTGGVSADPFLDLIARYGDRPDLLDKLVSVRNDELKRLAKVAFWSDFAQMQPNLPTIDRKGRIEIRKKDKATGERDGEVQQSSAYAMWADIMEACRPAMLEFGFGLSFRQEPQPDGKIVVIGMLAHRDGHIEENRSIPLQHESTGNKNWHQAIGSTLSYGMRYCGIMLLGVSSKEHDDDKGGAPEQSVFVTDEQVRELEKIIADTGANKQKFLAYVKEDSLDQMPAIKFERAKEALLARTREPAQ